MFIGVDDRKKREYNEIYNMRGLDAMLSIINDNNLISINDAENESSKLQYSYDKSYKKRK